MIFDCCVAHALPPNGWGRGVIQQLFLCCVRICARAFTQWGCARERGDESRRAQASIRGAPLAGVILAGEFALRTRVRRRE